MVYQRKLVTALLLLTVSVSSAFTGQKPKSSRQFSSSFSKDQCHPQQHHHVQAAPLYLSSQPINSNDGDSAKKQLSRRRQMWRKSKKTIASVALALSFLRSPAAYASTTSADMVDTSGRANDVFMESLRPGASMEDAELAMDVDTVVREKTDVNTAKGRKDEAAKAIKKKLKTKKAKNLYYDEEDDLDDELAQMGESETATKGKSALKTTTTSDIYLKTSKTGTSTYVKATLIFITLPVLLFGGIETYKRRSESAYVKKALKIQAIKKQEHMTETAEEEARLEALKNETDTGDDDDDDDDDDNDDDDDDDDEDEDDEDENDAPPKPKKPRGDDGDGGDDAPSADDIDRLNKLMGR